MRFPAESMRNTVLSPQPAVPPEQEQKPSRKGKATKIAKAKADAKAAKAKKEQEKKAIMPSSIVFWTSDDSSLANHTQHKRIGS